MITKKVSLKSTGRVMCICVRVCTRRLSDVILNIADCGLLSLCAAFREESADCFIHYVLIAFFEGESGEEFAFDFFEVALSIFVDGFILFLLFLCGDTEFKIQFLAFI